MRPVIILLLLSFAACKKEDKLPPINEAVDLDGALIDDTILTNPRRYTLSDQPVIYPNRPVFIAVHGFSASSFEWSEFAAYCENRGDVLVSRILLGGHGRDYHHFRDAAWVDWQRPIIAEYNKLRAQGYRNIHIVAASTGCPLVLDMIAEQKIDATRLGHVIFVDPIVVPSNKNLSLAPVLADGIIKYSEQTLDPGENGYWYRFRPGSALRELDLLTRDIRKRLEKSMNLPGNVLFHVYKSEADGSADPISAVILDKGIKGCDSRVVSSSLHVFTRLAGRAAVTAADRELQTKTFEEFCSFVVKK